MAPRIGNKNSLKHGGKGTRLYKIWTIMRERCFRKNKDGWHRYGERGITVCSEWNDFAAFRDWAIANGYQQNLSLDRKDNDGNYEPSNCCWSSDKEQQNNRSTNRKLTARGETKNLTQWLEDSRCGLPETTLRNRLERGWDIERALFTPARIMRKK